MNDQDAQFRRKSYAAALLSALFALLLSAPGYADDYVVHVNGLVCSFCAQGVTKKVSKLPFVDQEKYTDGVYVEIEDQKVTIAVKPGQELDIDALFAAIESGGYEPVDIWTTKPTGELDQQIEYQP